MTPTMSEMLQVLYTGGHVGAGRGISAADLATYLGCDLRQLRKLITQARFDGIALCGKPADGYFIGERAEEVEETCRLLRSRAMHSLLLESAMRRMPLPTLIGQLSLPT